MPKLCTKASRAAVAAAPAAGAGPGAAGRMWPVSDSTQGRSGARDVMTHLLKALLLAHRLDSQLAPLRPVLGPAHSPGPPSATQDQALRLPPPCLPPSPVRCSMLELSHVETQPGPAKAVQDSTCCQYSRVFMRCLLCSKSARMPDACLPLQRPWSISIGSQMQYQSPRLQRAWSP